MGIDPIEDPPIKPGQPTEPPAEAPKGNPRPEIPPPLQDPGEPGGRRNCRRDAPDELPVRGPPGPELPNSPTDAAGSSAIGLNKP